MEDLLIIHSYILAYILATSRHLADKVYRPLLVSNPGRQTATIDGLTIPGALVHTATLDTSTRYIYLLSSSHL